MYRRPVLATLGATATLLLAGCLGDGDDDDDADDGAPDRDAAAIVEAYYESDDPDEIAGWRHEESTMAAATADARRVTNPEPDPEVIERNLDREAIADFVENLSDDGIDMVAERENALVEADVNVIDPDTGETGQDVETWLVAREGDNWVLVDYDAVQEARP